MPGNPWDGAIVAMDMFASPLWGNANPFCGYPKYVHAWLEPASRTFPLYISCAAGEGELLKSAEGEDPWLITAVESGETSLEPVFVKPFMEWLLECCYTCQYHSTKYLTLPITLLCRLALDNIDEFLRSGSCLIAGLSGESRSL
jgi:hypothetical protein